MGAALSEDLRKRVVSTVEAGASQRQAAHRFGVSLSSAKVWRRQWRQHGHVAAKPQGGDRRSHRIEAQADFLLKQIEQTPDVTLAELQDRLRRHGLSVGIATVSASKKTPHAEKHHRPDVARRRQAWLETQSALAGTVAVHRRDGRDDEDGAPLRSCQTWQTLPCFGAWPMENDDAERCAWPGWIAGTDGA